MCAASCGFFREMLPVMHEGGYRWEKIGRNGAADAVRCKRAIWNAHVCASCKKPCPPLCKRKKAGGEGKIFLHCPKGCPILMRIGRRPIHKMLRMPEDKCPPQ